MKRTPVAASKRAPVAASCTAAVLLALLLGGGLRAQTPQELHAEWKAGRLTTLDPALVKHADLLKYLERLRALGVPVGEVGRSLAGREIYQMEFGRGPLKVFMWSQMHGDEPTATTALIDLFAYLHANRDRAWVRQVAEKITLRGVPMLNPDGAELWQRRNLQGIDINRDALALSTPEGRLLKRLRDEWRPGIGFNLHNQNPRYAVGHTRRQAALSLLAVPSDEARTDTPGRVRNKKLCAVMVEALAPFVDGHIGRYDDTFNPRAFGDNISRWGTPVILVETGGLRGLTGHELAGLNFVALASALRALADGSYERADPSVYDRLPENVSGTIFDLVVRGGTVVAPARDGAPKIAPYAADLAVNVDAGRGGTGPRRASVQDVGDLSVLRGLEEVDASGYYVVATGGARPGAEAALLFYPKERAAGLSWDAPDLQTRHPPEAVFRRGEWVRRGRLPIK
ncbi:MAG TPA: M14 family zinc carboxypeptidase [Pyrinomonadaceae bacterium]|nr:M14 family zinc carboxypeptidase [Pyrinomonadaceae bacterium]